MAEYAGRFYARKSNPTRVFKIASLVPYASHGVYADGIVGGVDGGLKKGVDVSDVVCCYGVSGDCISDSEWFGLVEMFSEWRVFRVEFVVERGPAVAGQLLPVEVCRDCRGKVWKRCSCLCGCTDSLEGVGWCGGLFVRRQILDDGDGGGDDERGESVSVVCGCVGSELFTSRGGGVVVWNPWLPMIEREQIMHGIAVRIPFIKGSSIPGGDAFGGGPIDSIIRVSAEISVEFRS